MSASTTADAPLPFGFNMAVSGRGIIVGGFDADDVKGQALGAAVDLHRAAGSHVAFEDLFGDGIFQQPFNGTAQRRVLTRITGLREKYRITTKDIMLRTVGEPVVATAHNGAIDLENPVTIGGLILLDRT